MTNQSTKNTHKLIVKEVYWVVAATLFYCLCWFLSLYFLGSKPGIFGFPLWFEFACIYSPIVFIALIYFLIKRVFVSIDFNQDK